MSEEKIQSYPFGPLRHAHFTRRASKRVRLAYRESPIGKIWADLQHAIMATSNHRIYIRALDADPIVNVIKRVAFDHHQNLLILQFDSIRMLVRWDFSEWKLYPMPKTFPHCSTICDIVEIPCFAMYLLRLFTPLVRELVLIILKYTYSWDIGCDNDSHFAIQGQPGYSVTVTR